MNAYAQDQISRFEWHTPTAARAYRRFQEAPRSVPKVQESEILVDLERQMAQFETQYEAKLREIATHYTMPGDSSVRDFLRTHRNVPELLLEAVPYLRRHFGPVTVLALRAPIDESGAQTLYGLVMWPGDVNEIRQALERFDEDWWIAHSRQTFGDLSFGFELV